MAGHHRIGMRFRQYFGGLSLLAFLRQYADAIVRESFNEPRMNDVETIRAQAAPARRDGRMLRAQAARIP